MGRPRVDAGRWQEPVAFGLASLALAAAVSAKAVDPAFERDIDKMLEMTGAATVGEQFASAVVQQVGQSMRQN